MSKETSQEKQKQKRQAEAARGGRRIAEMLAEGRDVSEIAQEVGVSVRTVNQWKNSRSRPYEPGMFTDTSGIFAKPRTPETDDTGGTYEFERSRAAAIAAGAEVSDTERKILEMLGEGDGTGAGKAAKKFGVSLKTVIDWREALLEAHEAAHKAHTIAMAAGTAMASEPEAVQAASESPAAERPPVCEPQKALSETRADEQPVAAAVDAEASTDGQPQPAAETCSVTGASETVPAMPSVPMKPNPLYIETKSKHVQLLMQPSLHEKVKKLAARNGLSLNEFVHKALEALES